MNLKGNFITGIAIILPMAVTLWIVMFLVNLLTNPFLGILENILQHFNFTIADHPFFSLAGPDVALFLSRILVVLALIAIIILTGFLARNLFIKYLFRYGDYLIHRIPLVNKIYKASQDVVHTLIGENKKSFSQVVLVPFPHSKAYAIGLVTSRSLPEGSDPEHIEKVSIFVPGTPNPTMGFMLLYKKEQLLFLDMKTDDALKFVVSCGVMSTSFKIDEHPK